MPGIVAMTSAVLFRTRFDGHGNKFSRQQFGRNNEYHLQKILKIEDGKRDLPCQPKKRNGPLRESNPGPPAPKAGIIPLDQADAIFATIKLYIKLYTIKLFIKLSRIKLYIKLYSIKLYINLYRMKLYIKLYSLKYEDSQEMLKII